MCLWCGILALLKYGKVSQSNKYSLQLMPEVWHKCRGSPTDNNDDRLAYEAIAQQNHRPKFLSFGSPRGRCI